MARLCRAALTGGLRREPDKGPLSRPATARVRVSRVAPPSPRNPLTVYETAVAEPPTVVESANQSEPQHASPRTPQRRRLARIQTADALPRPDWARASAGQEFTRGEKAACAMALRASMALLDDGRAVCSARTGQVSSP
jgi:hypothetical protein